MKKTALLYSVLITLTCFSGQHLDAYKIYNSKGKEVSFEKVIKATKEKTHIFFGEYHNNAISHWLQLELTKRLFDIHKRNLVLGAEMFEADNQFILDEYLQGLISSKNFQNEMRLWPNYNTDYKPLVEFAKANQLKFIASNIPRRYANMVYKKGLQSLNKLSDLAKSYIVPLNQFEFDSTLACYKDIYQMPHGGEGMATAQAIKDATMAYFILKNTTPQTVFLHFQGAYHSDNYEGIIYYLKKQVDISKILTLSTVTQDDISVLEDENKGVADFIICVREDLTTTH
ncbi:MAG TPA: iron-regulated protein [Crocinitomix sp.]|nr:iron-regulated protein [Crocinitomix sp.]